MEYLKELNIEVSINLLFRQTKRRAKINGIEFALTKTFLLKMWEKQKGKCALTNIAFMNEIKLKGKRRPFSPSIDRINSRSGYTQDNVRLVCFAVNMALFTWGERVFDFVVEKRMELKNNITKIEPLKKKNDAPGLSRGMLESRLNLTFGTISAREKLGLSIPPHFSSEKHGSKIWYRYDYLQVIHWIKEHKDFLTWIKPKGTKMP